MLLLEVGATVISHCGWMLKYTVASGIMEVSVERFCFVALIETPISICVAFQLKNNEIVTLL